MEDGEHNLVQSTTINDSGYSGLDNESARNSFGQDLANESDAPLDGGSDSDLDIHLEQGLDSDEDNNGILLIYFFNHIIWSDIIFFLISRQFRSHDGAGALYPRSINF